MPKSNLENGFRDSRNRRVEPLQECAKHLEVHSNRVKAGRVGKLKAGSIQVVKHSYAASGSILDCDLLIVDEAHRAKGEGTAFSSALNQQKKHARRVLILTATPFSIRLDELQRMLTLIGGESTHVPVRGFSRALDNLYLGNTARSPQVVAERLALKAKTAVESLGEFVIRHGIDDLPAEQKSFGVRTDWNIDVPRANPEELELMMRMDRMLRVVKADSSESSKATNDPRFHVGWRHFDAETQRVTSEVPQLAEPAKAVVENQVKAIKALRDKVGIHHSKMEAVAAKVKATIACGEKVVLFCHHIATAQELTVHLNSVLPKAKAGPAPEKSVWRRAWEDVLEIAAEDGKEEALRRTFVEWLCADLIRSQTWSWLGSTPASVSADKLANALNQVRARHEQAPETIAKSAQRLYDELLDSKSSKAVLRAAIDRLELMPGANGASRVIGVCKPSENEREEKLFLHNQQPDTVISIFNSPFGPDALVVTDKMSEGIDLHRYCRHLIHYELDPSPIRTVQRNGRLRRVNSWAAVTGQPILYAYPAFHGTRDHRLVQIMKKRIDSFSLLLGGVQDIDVEDVRGSQEEEWRNQVIQTAKARLQIEGGKLRASQ